jgi:hypothetical protein
LPSAGPGDCLAGASVRLPGAGADGWAWQGTVITSKLETPSGGLVMVAGSSPDTKNWIRGRVPDFREQRELSWPKLSYATTVMVDDVDAHH